MSPTCSKKDFAGAKLLPIDAARSICSSKQAMPHHTASLGKAEFMGWRGGDR
jgi:hypothetical protein